MTPGELAAVRGRLEEFAAEVFAPLARADQRDKGVAYVRGLLDGRRKSMQPMAERLRVDYQGLQQFVSSSTWPVEPVRERLPRRAVTVIDPYAWVIDDTGFAKDGTASPGVARQYSGTLDKGRQLPGRGQRLRGDRHRVLPAVLALVPAARLGRHRGGR
jgi:SRSO17 transposase